MNNGKTGCFSSAEVVLVIDDSGSMQSNDRLNQRLDVAKTLIDRLPLGLADDKES